MRPPVVFLLASGSRRAAAGAALRTLADAAGAVAGTPLEPVVSEDRDGTGAVATLDAAVARHYAAGQRDFRIVPLFFGAGTSANDLLPARLAALRCAHAGLVAHVAPCLAAPAGDGTGRLACMLADAAGAALQGLREPVVILVDHGSSVPSLVAVRDTLAAHLRVLLGGAVRRVFAASMQLPDGASVPSLATVLDTPELAAADIVLAMQFLLPGRHAGPRGDIEQICAEAHRRHPRQQTRQSALIAAHPDFPRLVADRVRDALRLA
ncbi:MAG: hypothetical protein LBV28_05825 [Puniceicoccales bacterium]|jgi:sirohydrochlorin ferrochelatase|nr:hypothetical protein [Puniceicoccales bacterium]